LGLQVVAGDCDENSILPVDLYINQLEEAAGGADRCWDVSGQLLLDDFLATVAGTVPLALGTGLWG